MIIPRSMIEEYAELARESIRGVEDIARYAALPIVREVYRRHIAHLTELLHTTEELLRNQSE